MRVLMINYELPPIGGGGGKATLNLAANFVRRGHQVAVLTSHFRGLPRRETIQGARILRAPVLRRHADRCSPLELLSFTAAGTLAGLWLAATFRPHVVLAFFAFPSGPVALATRRLLGKPYVVSLRGSDVPRPEIGSSALSPFLRLALRRVCGSASAVTAVSGGLRSAALAAAPGLDVLVIPNGVDLDRFRPAEDSRPPGRVRLLYVGRLREFKGVRILLSAFASMARRAEQAVELHLVGDGPDRATLERLSSRLGITERVRFHGWVAYARITDFYHRADCLVLPSFVEGMPNVVLEAMACGLPVVGTDVAGTRELIRDGEEGRLVPRRNAEALGAALLQLVSDTKLRRRMGRCARERALEFSWQKAGDQYLDILSRIAINE